MDNVSHEFRTPLTVIKEYVSLLGEGLLGQVNGKQRRFLDIVGDRADDLNNMVDDMLDTSRLEAGMLGVSREKCRVTDVIGHVRASLERKAMVKGVSLTFDVDATLPEIYCDPEKTGRVITNLTVNAIKFCGESGLVRVWTDNDPSAHQVIVGVTDDGPGVDPQSVEAIFRRFKQVKPGRGSTKGFGLGLSIAKELVDLNLGKIDVQSNPEEGTIFTFTIP